MFERLAMAVMIGVLGALVLVDGGDSDSSVTSSVSPPTSVAPEPLPPLDDLTGGPVDGAHLTRLSNVLVETNEPVPFDHATTDESGMWDGDTAIEVESDGWYWVGANVTTLGTSYGGPSNAEVLLAVVANWDHESPPLTSYVASERFYNHPSGTRAELNSLLQPVFLEAGDVVELILVGVDEGPLLLESNPTDGLPDGYETDAGPGTLSPHLYLLAV